MSMNAPFVLRSPRGEALRGHSFGIGHSPATPKLQRRPGVLSFFLPLSSVLRPLSSVLRSRFSVLCPPFNFHQSLLTGQRGAIVLTSAVPIILFALLLFVLLSFGGVVLLSLALRYRAGTSRRQGRRWVATM